MISKSYFILELYTPHPNTEYADVTLNEYQQFSPKYRDKLQCSSTVVKAKNKTVTMNNAVYNAVVNFKSDYVGRIDKMYNLEIILRENIQQNSISTHKIVKSVEVIETNEY